MTGQKEVHLFALAEAAALRGEPLPALLHLLFSQAASQEWHLKITDRSNGQTRLRMTASEEQLSERCD